MLLAVMRSAKPPPRQDFFDCRKQFPSHAGFGYITLACFKSRISEIRVVVQRQENYFHSRIAPFYSLRHLDAAHVRHRNIEHAKIRFQSIDCFQEFRSITDRSQNLEPPSQQLHNLVPYLLMIIRN